MINNVVVVQFLHFDCDRSLLLEILDPFESPSFRLFLRPLRRRDPSFFFPPVLIGDPAHQGEIMHCHVAEIDGRVHLSRRGGQR